MLIDQATGRQVIWGFLLENTLFTEFDEVNHSIIEKAYSQRKNKQTSHYIVIRDSHLSCPARIYFGVAQVHLRMPGTRYYVKRNLSKITPVAIPSPTRSTDPYFQDEIFTDYMDYPSLVSDIQDILPLPSPPPVTNDPSILYHDYFTQDPYSWSAMMDPNFWYQESLNDVFLSTL